MLKAHLVEIFLFFLRLFAPFGPEMAAENDFFLFYPFDDGYFRKETFIFEKNGKYLIYLFVGTRIRSNMLKYENITQSKTIGFNIGFALNWWCPDTLRLMIIRCSNPIVIKNILENIILINDKIFTTKCCNRPRCLFAKKFLKLHLVGKFSNGHLKAPKYFKF